MIMNEKNFIVGGRKRRERGNFDKEKAISKTLEEMRRLWNLYGYDRFSTRIDLKLDRERFKMTKKDDFKNIIRVFDFVSKMKRAPKIKFILKR